MIPTTKIAQAPHWLIKQCGEPDLRPPAPKANNNTETAAALSTVIDYLLNDAPMPDEGSRNATAFKVAARCKDLGANETSTHHLMAGHWNPRTDNPLEHSELQAAVHSAYQYGRSEQGSASIENDFQKIEKKTEDDNWLPPAKKRPPLIIEAVEQIDSATIPQREWILGRHLLAGKVTVIIAPPGVGKSIISMAMAISNSSEAPEILGLDVHKRCNTLIINNEDDKDELSRRFAAIIAHHDIDWERLNGRIFMYSGVTRPFLMAKSNNFGDVQPVDKEELITFIEKNNIKVVVADPFIETHQVDENDNRQINQVGGMYRELAVRTGAAVVLIHHTKKRGSGNSDGYVGDMEGGRGASSLAGVARIILTVYGMSEKDAEAYGVPDSERHRYVRMDDSKSNMHLIDNVPRWFKKVGVELANGDEVGVLETVELIPQSEKIEVATLDTVQQFIEEKNGEATLNAVATAIQEDDITGKGESIRTIKRRLIEWLEAPKTVNGWEVWYVHEDGPNVRRQNQNMIYGRVVLDA